MATCYKKRLVLAGSGMAATAAIEEILKLSPGLYDITVIGKEKHPNYNRVLLSSVLMGEKKPQDIVLHSMDWYKDRDIKLILDKNITSIDRGKKKLYTHDGEAVPYDILIISTGSLPIIPDLPGIGKQGVVTFRDLGDCEKIRQCAKGGLKAVVIGGGLLGLEAAWGVKKLGMDSTVVHLMDRLMERQLDHTAAGLLKEDIEKLGIKVLLNKKTAEVLGEEKAEGLMFEGGESLQADLVILSIGIRPNISIAQNSGLYCEKGIVVSQAMQTYDPAIYAIGECVQYKGETFGLVAPIFEQARVVADHLAGMSRLVFKPAPLCARLKIPGIELYSAGSLSQGAETIEYLDKGAKVYKKAFIEDNRLSGIVMYNDTADGPKLFDLLIKGEDIGSRRRSLLLGDTPAVTGAQDLPDSAIVCGCNGVTKGAIVDAIKKKGLFTREDVRRETNATGSCGGCAPVVDRILESVLGSNFQSSEKAGICPCTGYGREDIIRNIKEKGLKSVQEVMETLGWDGVGCDICRPALNYYVSMVWPGKAIDDSSSRLVNERSHANIQKDGAFSVVPDIPGGAVTPDELRRIAKAADDYKIPLVKITGGQRIGLMGVRKKDLEKVWKDLAMPSGFAYAKAMRTAKTCVGSAYCRYGTQDSLSLGIELEKKLSGIYMPAKVKIGASGCPRNCAESRIKDIGIVGIAGGYEIYAGGCAGVELKAGQKLAVVESAQEAMDVSVAFIQLYREEAHYGERTFKWLSSFGIEAVKKTIVEDKASRAALIERFLQARKFSKDPWNGKGAGLPAEI